MRRPVAAVDEAVTGWIKRNLLQESLVVQTIREVRRRVAERAELPNIEVPALEATGRQLKDEIDRLTSALAQTDEKPEAIVQAIVERDRKLVAARSRLEIIRTSPEILDHELRGLEDQAHRRVEEFRALLDGSPEEARKAMEALLEGPLTFKPALLPEGKRYEVEGPATSGPLFPTVCDPTVARTVGKQPASAYLADILQRAAPAPRLALVA